MTKPVTVPNTWAATVGSTTGAALDANFTAVLAALNDPLTYSNYVVDVGAANAYVVTLSPAPSAYTAGLRIEFKAVNANTGASTINVNALGVKNIVDQGGNALLPAAIAAGQVVVIEYDGTNFQMIGEAGARTFGGPINTFKASDVASAATTNIGAATGNYISITGTTTITAFDTIQAGVYRICVFSGVLTLTYNATSLILPSKANITTAAGDAAIFYSLGGGNWICVAYQRANGQALLGSSVGSVQILGTKVFGAKNIPANAISYIGEMGTALSATEGDRIFWVNQPVMLRDLLVQCNTNVTAQSITAVWRKNGADTALTCTVANGTSTASDTTNTITAGFGDYLTLKVSTPLGFTPTTLDLNISTRFVDPTGLYGISMWPFNMAGATLATDRIGSVGVFSTVANKAYCYKPFVHSNVYLDRALIASTTFSGNINATFSPGAIQLLQLNANAGANSGNIAIGSTPVLAAYADRIGTPIASQSFLDAAGGYSLASGSISFVQKESTALNQIMPIWLTSIAHAQNTTLYMAGHGGTGSATESEYQFRIKSGTLKNFFLYNVAAGVAGQTWTATLRKNGVDTSVVLIISGTGQVAVDTTSTITSVDTDIWSVRLVSSATTGTSTLHFAMDHVP